MKNFRRIASLLLVLAMVLGMFTGCKKEEEKKPVSGERKLTVGIPQNATVANYDTNKFTLYLEETAGVDIEWVYFASSAVNYQQQLTLMCTGGEKMPDVVVGMLGLSHYSVNQFGEDGYLVDLRELIKEYAPNYRAQLAGLDKNMQKYIEEKGTNTVDGSFYAMPYVGCGGMDNLQSMTYINKTWLDKLGLQVPANINDLVAVCRAFLTKDPNGNGQNDEIPMLGDTTLRYWLMNAFVEYYVDGFNVTTDGKVWDPVLTDEYRQSLIFVNDLVKEGLFSELNFTLSNTEIKNLISPVNAPGKVGIFSGNHLVMTNATTDILNDYVVLGPLDDATGKGGYCIVREEEPMWGAFITKDCENPELAMEFLDVFYMDETVSRMRHGEKDVDWVYEEGKNPYGTDSYVKAINTEVFFDGSLNSTFTSMNTLGILTFRNYLNIAEEGEGRNVQSNRLLSEGWQLIQTARKQENQVSQLVYTDEEYEIREEKIDSVTTYLNEQTVLFMQGEKDPRDDKQWNEFKNTLQALGRGELMDIAQSAYNRKLERMK